MFEDLDMVSHVGAGDDNGWKAPGVVGVKFEPKNKRTIRACQMFLQVHTISLLRKFRLMAQHSFKKCLMETCLVSPSEVTKIFKIDFQTNLLETTKMAPSGFSADFAKAVVAH